MTKNRPKGKAESLSSLSDVSSNLGNRLRALLHLRGSSIDNFAAFSGLGKKKLEGLAMGEVVPTINSVWKIANALGVPFGSLVSAKVSRDEVVLRKTPEQIIASSDGRFTSRALLPHDSGRHFEFYELTIAPEHVAHSEAHGAGTLENIVVVRGQVEIIAGKEPPRRLTDGDAMTFTGDVPHSYRNLGSSEALLYLVMSYIDLGGH